MKTKKQLAESMKRMISIREAMKEELKKSEEEKKKPPNSK